MPSSAKGHSMKSCFLSTQVGLLLMVLSAVIILVVHALDMVTIMMLMPCVVCSAGAGEDVRACAQGQVCGQGHVQDGTSAVCIRTVGDRSIRDAIKAIQESLHQ